MNAKENMKHAVKQLMSLSRQELLLELQIKTGTHYGVKNDSVKKELENIKHRKDGLGHFLFKAIDNI